MTPKLRRLLHARGMTLEKLGELTMLNPSHLSQVLGNKNGRGAQTRKRLAPYLMVDEWTELGWPQLGEEESKVEGLKSKVEEFRTVPRTPFQWGPRRDKAVDA